MNQKTLTSAEMQDAVDAVYQHGSVSAAAEKRGMARSSMSHRYKRALSNGFTPTKDVEPDSEHKIRLLEDRCKALETQLTKKDRTQAIDAWIRAELFKMVQTPVTPPSWVHAPGKMAESGPGTPFLALGDWHWGEVIDPNQIDGLNEYNINIAHRRAKNVIDTAVDLLQHHMVKPDYPGLVVSLLGDMVSGDIHQELQETNELPTIPTVLDVVGVLQQSLKYLADHFGRVHVVCVVGNHGRNTKKMQAKGRTATSFDWLSYKILELQCNDDERITFQIPEGADTRLKVYNHDYLITHGDQFRGGDGIIGPLGPLVRGDYKKRLRESMVDSHYDTMLCGHFHRLITLSQLIVNGSLVGYNEYAYTNNFPFEPPKQALWVTHPRNGITFTLPVLAEKLEKKPGAARWLSLPA